jgi:hypothetical protein
VAAGSPDEGHLLVAWAPCLARFRPARKTPNRGAAGAPKRQPWKSLGDPHQSRPDRDAGAVGAFFNRRAKKPLAIEAKAGISGLAQIARACGRVSVGGDPDKRPVNHRIKTGSRRRTGEPRLSGGSRLKATTDRAFSSLSALQSRLTEEASLSCRACGSGHIPFQTMAEPLDERAFARRRERCSANGASPDCSASA